MLQAKPQEIFKDEIDNSTNPFVPKIKEKPNALQPLSKFLPSLLQSELPRALISLDQL